MVDKTIADLTDGVTALATDRIPIARSPYGATDNRYVTPAYIARDLAREKLFADRNYYVATTGLDTNDGSSGAPFLTVQKAVDVVSSLDLSTFRAFINIADGTYAGDIVLKPLVGGAGHNPAFMQSSGNIVGNSTTLGNVIVGHITINGDGWCIGGIRRNCPGNTSAIGVVGPYEFVLLSLWGDSTGGAGNYLIAGQSGSSMICVSGSLKISGTQWEAIIDGSGSDYLVGVPLTILDTPVFTKAAIHMAYGSSCQIYFSSITGTATGPRYWVQSNAAISTFTFGELVLPGSLTGIIDTGGIFESEGDYRVKVRSNVTYYCSPSGNNTNPGTLALPFLTIQKAVDTIAALDLGGLYTATVQLADGTYNSVGLALKDPVGGNVSSCIILGNPTTPSNVIIQDVSGAAPFGVFGVTCWTINGVKVTTPNPGVPLFYIDVGSTLSLTNVEFNIAAFYAIGMFVFRGCFVQFNVGCRISAEVGNLLFYFIAVENGFVQKDQDLDVQHAAISVLNAWMAVSGRCTDGIYPNHENVTGGARFVVTDGVYSPSSLTSTPGTNPGYALLGAKISTYGDGALYHGRDEIFPDVDGKTIDLAETGRLFTNEGATAIAPFILPSAIAGLENDFVVQNANGIRVTAAAGNTIRIASEVSAAAGKIESTAIGSVVTLRAINATEWMAIRALGTWTVT